MKKYRKGRHSVFLLNAHLVFVTKYRRKVFDKEAIESLSVHFEQICNGLNCDLEECNGEVDHMHLVVSMAPTVSVSSLVNALKGASSRILRKERVDLRDKFYKNVLWSKSYFATSTGGAPLEVVKKYVQSQKGEGDSSPASTPGSPRPTR